VLPHDRDLPARKLWIAFAVGSTGTLWSTIWCVRRAGGNFSVGGWRGRRRQVSDPMMQSDRHAGWCGSPWAGACRRATAKDIAGRRSVDLPAALLCGARTTVILPD
jgi:hypothetical protein